uniref:Cell shape-determining protein MreC n=1 Tax=uncultured Thiotrichaceae bacterium TaxID=298394 RepID=A0A6S6SI20_9GAMM|nr:MAG: Rod shape-determining protein MreC [uncultured Thiotrichaceae bacterium]
MLIALTLMFVDHRSPSNTLPVRTLFSIIGYPLQLTVDAPFRAYNVTEGFFADHTQMSKQNSELEARLLQIKADYRNMQIIKQQNERLRSLLKIAKRPDFSFTMAEILSASDYRGQSVVTINKGSRDGVFVKQVVVADGENAQIQGGNIFGQVISVTPFSSQVILITDLQHAIPVRNLRTDKRALASGTGKPDFLELKSIVAESDVHDGDIFVSSGLDGLFPADFPVAEVVPNGVNYVPGDPFANIKARPLINFQNTREVLLLWRNAEPEVVEKPTPEEIGNAATDAESGSQATEAAQ